MVIWGLVFTFTTQLHKDARARNWECWTFHNDCLKLEITGCRFGKCLCVLHVWGGRRITLTTKAKCFNLQTLSFLVGCNYNYCKRRTLLVFFYFFWTEGLPQYYIFNYFVWLWFWNSFFFTPIQTDLIKDSNCSCLHRTFDLAAVDAVYLFVTGCKFSFFF